MSDPGLFDFLSENQQILTWLGGGAATVGGAAWVVIKYLLDRGANKDASDKPSAQAQLGSGTRLEAASGSGVAGRDLHVGDHVSIQQNLVSRGGIIVAVIGLLLLGIAIVNAGHNITISSGNYVGGAVTNSQLGVTTTRSSDEKQR